MFALGLYRCNFVKKVRRNVSQNISLLSPDMYHREARPQDLLEILQLYREYNQSEPVSLSLGLPDRHLEININIIASFKRLISSRSVLLCCEGNSVLGMAVHYTMPCLPASQEDVLNFSLWHGYPDLAPAMLLSNMAVESVSLSLHYRTVGQTTVESQS